MLQEWIRRDIPTIKASFRFYLTELKRRWWIPIGMFAYYIAFSTLGNGAGVASVLAFLLGFAFGGFCVRTQPGNQRPDLRFMAGLYVVLHFPAIFIVWLALFTPASTYKLLLLLTGLVLVYMTVFFGIKAYADREASFRLRMYVLFGPVIFGGLTGLGGVSLAAGTYGIMPDRFWWVALIFLVGSIAPATVACIFLILLGLESGQPPVPPPRRAAA